MVKQLLRKVFSKLACHDQKHERTNFHCTACNLWPQSEHWRVSAGRQHYFASLEEQKKEQQQAPQNRKLKIVLEEKAELEKKRKCLASISVSCNLMQTL